jgi:hypothetical protein
MTDFRARGTIMGPTGLTAVFGMGTGVTPPVWSPEMPPAGGRARRGISSNWVVGHARGSTVQVRRGTSSAPLLWAPTAAGLVARGVSSWGWPPCDRSPRRGWVGAGDGSGWSSDRLLGPVRCGGRPPYTPGPSTWSSSRSLHSLR